MSISTPPPGMPGDSGRWKTIRYAIGSNARTVRLCLISLTAGVVPAAAAAVVEAVRHIR